MRIHYQNMFRQRILLWERLSDSWLDAPGKAHLMGEG